MHPRVDVDGQRVYIPRGERGNDGQGSWTVVYWETQQSRPTRVEREGSVGYCMSVAALSLSFRLCACASNDDRCSLIAVPRANGPSRHIKLQLEGVEGNPKRTAVLGTTILVSYSSSNTLIICDISNSSSIPRSVDWPDGLQGVSAMSSDAVSRFFLCDSASNAVFILEKSGQLCDKININIGTDRKIHDCAWSEGELLVGCDNGDIVAMTPQ